MLREHSVNFGWWDHDKDGLTFHSFGPKDFYGNRAPKGNGAKVLDKVCEWANKHNVPLRLWTVVPKLVPYYEAFGFVVTRKADDHPYWVMQRTPQ